MKKLLMVATILSLAGVLGQTAAAAGRSPGYDVTCSVSGWTTATWSHASLDQVTFEWFDAGGNGFQSSVPVAPHPPHGTVDSAAWTEAGPNFSPVSVTVSFERADGSGSDPVADVPCS
jgi:hypothetical protein